MYTKNGLVVETCVNLIAGLVGKKGPYLVPVGTFTNEPAIDALAELVQ
jgi:hypothetical protein